jgi:PAS domain S-box-containing protein
MAWIGLLDTGSQQVVPVASAGEGVNYLKGISVTVRDEPSGRGPVGNSIRTGGHYVCNDFLSDPRIIPWRSEAEQRGFASLAAFAFNMNGTTIGSLALYSGEQGFFNEELVALLVEVADDISYALTNLDQETRRRKAEDHLRTLSTVVEQSPVCTFITDQAGSITYVNPAFNVLTGYAPEDVLGENPRLLQSGLTPPETYQDLWETITAGKTWQGEFHNMKKNGDLYWEWAVIAPVTDEQGGGTGYVAIKEDITRRKQREQELLTVEGVSAALRVMLTRTEMLPVVFDRVSTFFLAKSAALVMRSPDGTACTVELASGAAARWSGLALPEEEELIAQVIATGEPCMNMALTQGTRFNITENGFLLPAVACVPLVTHETVIGAFFIARVSAMNGDDLHLFNAFADMAAGAFHRASLHEKTEQRLARISTLREIDIAVSSTLDLRITLAILIDKIIAQLDVAAADILLLDPRTLSLTFAGGRGRRKTGDASQRLDGDYAGRAAREQAPVTIISLAERGDPFATDLRQEGFCSYHAVPLVSKGVVKGVLELYSRGIFAPDRELSEFLEALALQTAIAIENDKLFEELQRSNLELLLAYDTTIEGWSRALDLRDSATEGHSQRVTEMTLRIARLLGVSNDDLVHVRRGALLHDIGKIAIPDNILLKPGPLTDEEWALMRRHPDIARELLEPIPFLRPALPIPLYHHEQWDGSGYPNGLKGEQIPLVARIFAVVDVWDATISNRPYRPAWTEDQVRENIRSLAGTHLDPHIVELFLSMDGE